MISVWFLAVLIVAAEVLLLTVLLFPMPAKIVRLTTDYLLKIRHFFLAPALIFLLAGYNAYLGFTKETSATTQGQTDVSSALHFQNLLKNSRHQRNFYISFAGLLLSIMLYFLIGLVNESSKLRMRELDLKKVTALKATNNIQRAEEKKHNLPPTTVKELEKEFPQ
ncbi:hypothetical protein AKO1_014715 [Acrasis kona]|uniref:Endoplasmic reticulum transmembrane protein n=1 Tax=Acrasis kona TaxID=1008807 RepID=A0AAW2Z343_9EUKA